MSFNEFVLREEYKRIKEHGDRLGEIDKKIEWERFRGIIKSIYKDNKIVGGRPHTDEIIIAKCLILQGLYGLSDEQLEYQCLDRISFRNFLHMPKDIPDFTTIWYAKERLAEKNKDDEIWQEFQRQLSNQGFTIQKGVIQDATIQEAKKPLSDTKRKGQDKDGSFTIKGNKTYYGYKLHAKTCVDYGLIREIATTSASPHDSNINLIRENDVAAYRDKGYDGTPIPKNVKNCTLKKSKRNHPLTKKQLKENLKLSKIRAPAERVFHVMKNCFHTTKIYVTTLYRVHIRNVFSAIAYNLFHLVTLQNNHLAIALKN